MQGRWLRVRFRYAGDRESSALPPGESVVNRYPHETVEAVWAFPGKHIPLRALRLPLDFASAGSEIKTSTVSFEYYVDSFFRSCMG